MKITITIEDKEDGTVCIETDPKASTLVKQVATKQETTAAHDYFFAAVTAFKQLSLKTGEMEESIKNSVAIEV
jgi:hypothetical protein